MLQLKNILFIFLCITLFAVPVLASNEEQGIDSEKMIEELEKRLQLSRDQWEKLKPVLDEKSRELKQSMHESIDKGYVKLEELSKELGKVSENAEKKLQEVLTSDEAQKFREYLGKVDKEAVQEAKDKMVAELTALLELTEKQAAKLKPVLDDTLAHMTVLFNEFVQEGSKNWETFSKEFEKLTRDLTESLQGTLDNEQMKRLEQYNKEQKVKIQKAFFTA